MSKKYGVFITARVKSHRFDKKILKNLDEKYSVIEFVVDRAKKVKSADEIVICTTEEESDDVLCKIAENNKINIFRGSTKDKLDRWNQAAKKFGLEGFACLDADDPFCDIELMENSILQLKSTGADLIKSSPDLICGGFSYAVNAKSLNTICSNKESLETEMMWHFFEQDKNMRIEILQNVDLELLYTSARLTIDYEEDLVFFQKIFNELKPTPTTSLKEIISFLKENVEMSNINYFRQANYEDNQKEILSRYNEK
jgi:spore coat polysaccharide biosynthesis protein SpsF